MENKKFYGMLGLSVRANAVVFGEGAVKDNIRKNAAKLVIMSADASDNTKKKFRDSCSFYSVPYVEVGDRYTLGSATGKTFAVVLAVTNQGLAENISAILKDTDTDIL